MNDDTENAPKKTIHIALPNGVILTLIGFFLFITPFAVALEMRDRVLDWVAGALLMAGGLVQIWVGLRAMKRRTRDSS